MTDRDAAADALAGRIFGAVLETFDIYAVYIGDRLGYYRALAADGPATSVELAARVGVAERHTREWLEQQATTGYLSVDDVGAEPTARRYALPPGHEEVLTDTESLRYLAPAARQVASAGTRLPEVVEAYRSGGGVSWDEFGPDMRESQGDVNRATFLRLLGSDWFPAIPDVHAALQAGGRVADVGCGHGWSSIAMALAYPEASVDGFDPDEPAVETARANAAELGLQDRVRFHVDDAALVEGEGRFDLVAAFECIHDLPYPVEVLRSMRRLRGPDGTVVVMDERSAETFGAIGDDVERYLYGFSTTVCLIDAMSSEGASGTGTVMRPSTLRLYALEAGFSDMEVLPIEHDGFRFYRLTG